MLRHTSCLCVLSLASIAAGVLQLSGCASAVIASAGITAGFALVQSQADQFINGEVKAARQVSIEQAQVAVRNAMAELQLDIKADRGSSHKAYIMGKAKGGPDIGVNLSIISPVATKVEIRVGIFGDQAVSRLVMNRIDAHLGHFETPSTLPAIVP